MSWICWEIPDSSKDGQRSREKDGSENRSGVQNEKLCPWVQKLKTGNNGTEGGKCREGAVMNEKRQISGSIPCAVDDFGKLRTGGSASFFNRGG